MAIVSKAKLMSPIDRLGMECIHALLPRQSRPVNPAGYGQ